MYHKVLMASALALGLGGTAMAETDTMQVPAEWSETIATALFSDVTAGAVRPADELTRNFKALTPEEQIQVKDHCKQFTEAGSGGRTPGPTEGSDQTAVREVCATVDKI